MLHFYSVSKLKIEKEKKSRKCILLLLANFQVISCKNDTLWKFHNFSMTQILREINFGDSISAKSVIWAHFEALNFDFYEFLHFLKAEIYQINKIQNSKNGKSSSFRTSRFSKIDFT